LAENVSNFKYFKPKRIAALREIRRLVIAGQSHNQIQQQLNLNERTYWRYWKAAFAEDRARLFSTVTAEEVQTQVAIGEARLTDIYRNLHEMGQDTDLDAIDRREAEDMAAEVAMGLLRLYQEGPLKVVYDNNRREQQQLQPEESEEDQHRSSGSQIH
jgi:hypothetical protein